MATATSGGKVTPPLETKAQIDKDYDYYISKYNAQAPPPPPANPPRPSNYSAKYNHHHGNLGVIPMEPVMEQLPMGGTPPRPPVGPSGNRSGGAEGSPEEKVDGDEALLDLAQLEELHHEAERMKALGNKHMAAQEYTRAYNAYSAALQLSPVGPSSHVFLSNRSAALLSLKRYSAAATDARRAIALAPTFGKAHARLGQALYFLKDYEGAVAAYEDAIHYEPDNSITKTYLEKAKTKCDRQKEKQAKSARGEEMSVLTENTSIQGTVENSVATDPNAQNAVVKTMGFRGQSNAMSKAVGGGIHHTSSVDTVNTVNTEDDPDFEEALRIQERANRYLANKNYKYAIEEYTAALFLVPDDYNLSPDLHLGRAHALNGSRRHESAKIDATLALRIKQSPEAYSTLAKSLFYLKDYQGAIEAFGRCKDLLPEGESLSMFDRAYLQKSEAALQEALASEDGPSASRSMSSTAPIPKLKPPRFVPREEALSRTPNIPAMPKSWPQQTPHDANTLQCGPEREVMFLSEALGIKLNRGPDGVVRVIDVSPEIPGSPIAREGKIYVGDVIREAAGVDLRRPITNIMWGDTVALIKMAPRPIVLMVAEELNPPPTISEQRKALAANALSPTSAAEYFPSNSSGDEGVKELLGQSVSQRIEPPEESGVRPVATLDHPIEVAEAPLVDATETERADVVDTPSESAQQEDTVSDPAQAATEDEAEVAISPADGGNETTNDEPDEGAREDGGLDQRASTVSLRDEEQEKLGKEIFFHRNANPKYNGWDNLRWMSYSGARKIEFVGPVCQFVPGRRALFWSGDQYLERSLVVYSEPKLILIVRPPEDMAEVLQILDLPPGATANNAEEIFRTYLVVESVVEPKTCKLRLSPLTTATSVLPDVGQDDARRRSCFELLTPLESVILSAVRLRKGAERALTSFTDSGAYLETTSVEHILQKCICEAHKPVKESGVVDNLSWKHQVVLGTLHSHVVLGNQKILDLALAAARTSSEDGGPGYVDARIIDAVDESGRTPLHYACSGRLSSAVSSLVKAGANVDTRAEPYDMTPCHLCALHLDFKSLQAILSVNKRPNVVDSWGRTPLYLAVMEGRSVGLSRNPAALESCLSVLESHGAQVEAPMGFQHPVSALAADWSHEELAVVLKHVHYRYPLAIADASDRQRVGISVSALYQYPVHSCLVALRKFIQNSAEGDQRVDAVPEKKLSLTLDVLLKCGFEPNERLEGLVETFDGVDDLAAHFGFAPLQILAAAALDAMTLEDKLGVALYMNVMKEISNAMETIIGQGGRSSLDPPPTLRSKDRRSSSSISDSSTGSQEVRGEFLVHDRTLLKLQSNKKLLEILGGARLLSAEKSWTDLKPVAATPGSFVFHTDKLAIDDSEAPGGSDVKTCAICWKGFGTITNRKHRCRISRRHICDECSSKRVIDGEEHRVSDGQFLLARADLTESRSRKQEQTMARASTADQQSASARILRLEAEESANRDSLFGNVIGNMAKAVFGEDDQTASQSHSETIQGLSETLGQTRNQLIERGDKLNTLADKSDRLVNASKDFASMAKELNRQTQGGFFW